MGGMAGRRLAVIILCWTHVTATNFQYLLVTSPKTFDNADDHCQQIVNGHLARVYDETTAQNIGTFIDGEATTSASYWLGAQSSDDTVYGLQGVTAGARLWRWLSETDESFLLSQGCYNDDLSVSEFQDFIKDNTTVSECVNLCRVQDYLYAAIKLGENCYCGDVFGRYGTVISNPVTGGPAHNCDLKCKREPGGPHHCGGVYNDVYSVYKVGGVAGTWNRNSPNNDVIGNQQCGRLQSKWNDDYKLDDYECYNTLPSLCVNLASCRQAGDNSFTAGDRSYCLTTGQTTWYEADSACRQRGGYLADLSRESDFATVTTTLKGIAGRPSDIWVGLGAHGWTWTEPSSGGSYWNWASSQPSGLNTGQKCVVMTTPDDTWSDEPCTNTHPFICQIDQDECSAAQSPCGSGAQCINTPGSYECQCDAGYRATQDGCTDIDECVSDPCHVDARCTNTDGTYTCTCNVGYVGDGLTCTQVVAECADSSLNNCDVNAACVELDVGYDCSCRAGFVGDGLFCVDIDECSSANLNDCAPGASCTNTPGGYSCTCRPGYQSTPTACIDVDECSSSNNCDVNAVCANLPGTYSCTCKTGYTGTGAVCSDVDECSSANTCDVNAECINLPGTYSCTCMAGYTGDGTTCTGITSTASTQTPQPSTTTAPPSTAASTAQSTAATPGGDTTTAGVVAPGTAGASTSGSGLGTAEIILIIVCVLLILLIIILFACVIYYKRKNNNKNKVAIDNNFDARPEARVAYGGNLGEDYYYSSSEAGSTAGLVVPNKNTRTMGGNPRHTPQPRIMVDDDDKY